MKETHNAFENAKSQIQKAFDLYDDGGDNAHAILTSHKRILDLDIPVKMDDGNVKIFK